MGPQYPQNPLYPPPVLTPPTPKPKNDPKQVALGCAIMLVILLLATFAGYRITRALSSSSPTPTLAPQPPIVLAATSTIAPPTATPKPTGPQVISGPYLGGTQDVFDSTFGQPNIAYGQAIYTYSLSDGTAIRLCFCATETGTDGKQRVWNLQVSSADPSLWTPYLASQLTQVFLPPDATYSKDIQDPDVGTLHIYLSADLAASFPRSDFTNSNLNGPPVPAGSFAVGCMNPNGPGCYFVLGE